MDNAVKNVLLREDKANPSTVKLYRCDQQSKSYVGLNTTEYSVNSNYSFYKAVSPGFSEYYIGYQRYKRFITFEQTGLPPTLVWQINYNNKTTGALASGNITFMISNVSENWTAYPVKTTFLRNTSICQETYNPYPDSGYVSSSQNSSVINISFVPVIYCKSLISPIVENVSLLYIETAILIVLTIILIVLFIKLHLKKKQAEKRTVKNKRHVKRHRRNISKKGRGRREPIDVGK